MLFSIITVTCTLRLYCLFFISLPNSLFCSPSPKNHFSCITSSISFYFAVYFCNIVCQNLFSPSDFARLLLETAKMSMFIFSLRSLFFSFMICFWLYPVSDILYRYFTDKMNPKTLEIVPCYFNFCAYTPTFLNFMCND